MKRVLSTVLTTTMILVLGMAAAGPAGAGSVKDNRYEVFMPNPLPGFASSTMTFRSDNILVIEGMDGTGVYLAAASSFAAFYWAPDFYNGNDITLLLSGVSLDPFFFAFGRAYIGDDPDFIVIYGYTLYADIL